MINAIVKGIISLVISLVSILLYPIDALIDSLLPSLSNMISAVGTFLSICTSSIGWVLSCVGINGNIISLIVIFYTFKLTAPLLVYTIKLAIKWYDKLKL